MANKEEPWIIELREYCLSWLTSRDLNPNSEYHSGAGKVADKVLSRIQNHDYAFEKSTRPSWRRVRK